MRKLSASKHLAQDFPPIFIHALDGLPFGVTNPKGEANESQHLSCRRKKGAPFFYTIFFLNLFLEAAEEKHQTG